MSASAARALPSSAPEPAALAAFIRGIERRAVVLAELQCGDAAAGDAALRQTLATFRLDAARRPMPDWPERFWAGLLAQPALRGAVAGDTLPALQVLGAGPRAAVLLRLAAGLDEATAAAVLGLAEPTYRLALQRALPHRAGEPDLAAWQALQAQVQQRQRELPAARIDALAKPVERAASAPTGTPAPEASPRRPRGVLALLWVLLALCVLAFALTFWAPAARWLGEPHVTRRALPPAEEPASRYGVEAGLIAHADFEQLADPATDALARDADFDAWLAAQAASGAGLEGALAPVLPSDAATDASAAPETTDAPF